jgi:aconitase A
VAVIVWQLALQLSVQSVPITTKVVSSNLVHGKEYLIQQYVIKFVSDLLQVSGSFSTNKIVCHDITEILLKVALNTITLTLLK